MSLYLSHEGRDETCPFRGRSIENPILEAKTKFLSVTKPSSVRINILVSCIC